MIVIQCLVHHVPAIDPTFVPADHRHDVIAHPLEQGVAVQGRALLVLKNPLRNLVVPHQAMAVDEQVVLLAKRYIVVGLRKVVRIRLGVNQLPLQNVLRADAVELRRNDGDAARVLLVKLGLVDGRPDAENILVGVLQGGLGGCRHRQTNHQKALPRA
jgi:hypothetical protein